MSSTTTEATARLIDSGTAPTRYARGWHCIGLLKDFADGKPHSVEAFGTKLVVFAGEDGKVNVLDGYCRHMGGDLTQGTVKGNEIACPFHDWRWGGDGKCKAIPYAKRVPLRARTRTWPTMIENDQLFIWHDVENSKPPAELDIPKIDGDVDGPEWSNWVWNEIIIEGSNCREIVDNVVDMPHFFYIHYGLPTYFKNVFDGHIASQYLDTKGRNDVTDIGLSGGDDVLLKSEAHYFGPSYMINYLHNDYKGFQIENILINCHYPIDQHSFKLMYGVKVKKLPGFDDEKSDYLAGKFAKNVGLGFLQDVEIWKNKTRIDNPLLCEEDGPVYQLRRWYEQFYVDAAEVSEDMTQRFEFEIDTTHAVEAWEAEVAQNIARQESEKASAQASSDETAKAGPHVPHGDDVRRTGHAAVDGVRSGGLPHRRFHPAELRHLRRRGAGPQEQPGAHLDPVVRLRARVRGLRHRRRRVRPARHLPAADGIDHARRQTRRGTRPDGRRPAGHRPGEAEEVSIHRLLVAKVVAETHDAHSIEFEVPDDLAAKFTYKPGQFLTLRVPSDQTGSVARCYSLCSAPHDGGPLRVAVKRTSDGYASNWLCDNATPGMEVDVLVPAGIFTPKSVDVDMLLFAGGSGVTPILSILRSVLETGTGSVALIYANRDAQSVIFASALAELTRTYPERLVVVHWLESVQGLPSAANLAALAAPYASREVFVCGPGPFMDAVSEAMTSLGKGRREVHIEKFRSLPRNPFEVEAAQEEAEEKAAIAEAEDLPEPTADTPAPADDGGTVTVELDGTTTELAWPAEKKLLDVMLEAGLDAPYSCREGACSACACRLVEGKVELAHNEVLDQEDLDDGLILACQSMRRTQAVHITYE